MQVGIIGAGALGKSLAAFLSASAQVTIYERNSETRGRLRRTGFFFHEAGRRKKIHLPVADSIGEASGRNIELLVFATKVMDLRTAMKEASAIKPALVFLPQNGIFDFRWAQRLFPAADICRGVTTMACQETAHNEVRLFYRGKIYAGGHGASRIARLFRQCDVAAQSFHESSAPVWAKLIFSAVMNPLPVMTGKGYDVLRRDKEVWRLVRKAVLEGRTVAKALGVRLAFDPLKLIQRVRDGDLAGIAHRGSISQDISAGRPTEIDCITGALIDQARKVGLKTPALQSILTRAKASGA